MSTNRIFKSVVTVTGFSIITRGLSFIFKIYLSRTVGAEVMGLYQIAMTVFFLFIALSTGGISTVLSRKIAEDKAVGNSKRSLTLLSTSLIMGCSAALVCMVVAYLSLPYLGFIITDERAVPLLKIMLPALLSTTFYIIIRGWFWGNKYFTSFSASETIEEILRILFTLLLVSGVVSGVNGTTGLAIAFTLSDVIVGIIIIIMFMKKGGKFTKHGDFGEILRPATPLTIMKIFGSLAGTAVAIILPQGLIAGGATIAEATASVGRISGMANPLLFAPNAIIGSLAIVLIPELSADNAKGNASALKDHVTQGVTAATAVSGAFMLIYAALGKELTQFLYADIPSGEYLEVACILLLLMPIGQMIASTMNSIGMEKENFISYAAGTILMIIACITLPKLVGVNAIIIADGLFLSVSTLLNVYFLKKHINGSLGILKALLTVALVGVSCIVLTENIYAITKKINQVFALILSGASGAISYMILLVVSGMLDIKTIISKRLKA
ncbi:MAG: oligosaccharide flippase family protein [Clostridia bacterium]|nr:oligosaccharide flippase family protein [Clostridia bacterium]